MVSQIDFLASFASFLKIPVPKGDAPDSENHWNAFIGKSKTARTVIVSQGGGISITSGNWKYIEPRNGPAVQGLTNIETGNSREPQLYDLKADIGEKNNLASKYPEKVKELAELLKKIRGSESTTTP
jgi:hypothetical protein